jgi:hypothetical protein
MAELSKNFKEKCPTAKYLFDITPRYAIVKGKGKQNRERQHDDHRHQWERGSGTERAYL